MRYYYAVRIQAPPVQVSVLWQMKRDWDQCGDRSGSRRSQWWPWTQLSWIESFFARLDITL